MAHSGRRGVRLRAGPYGPHRSGRARPASDLGRPFSPSSRCLAPSSPSLRSQLPSQSPSPSISFSCLMRSVPLAVTVLLSSQSDRLIKFVSAAPVLPTSHPPCARSAASIATTRSARTACASRACATTRVCTPLSSAWMPSLAPPMSWLSALATTPPLRPSWLGRALRSATGLMLSLWVSTVRGRTRFSTSRPLIRRRRPISLSSTPTALALPPTSPSPASQLRASTVRCLLACALSSSRPPGQPLWVLQPCRHPLLQ